MTVVMIRADQIRKRQGHLHVVCPGIRGEAFGCIEEPHIHYDRSGFCSNGAASLHYICRGTYDASGKYLNCPCDCHRRALRKLRRLFRTYEPIPILDRLRGA